MQHCCHLLIGRDANKVEESLHSEQYYQKDGKKLEDKSWGKPGDKISLEHVLFWELLTKIRDGHLKIRMRDLQHVRKGNISNANI